MAQPAQTAARPAGGKPAAQPTFEEQPFAVKLLLLVILLGVIGGVYYFALHMSLAEEISAAESQHASLLERRAAAERRQQEYQVLSQELADREPIDRLNKRILPENPEIPAFLEDINRVAELSGLAIRRVEPEDEITDERYVRIPLAMVIEGRFHQFAKFFYNIGQLERAASMHVRDIRYATQNLVQRPTSTGALPEVMLVVALDATAFRRPVNEPAAAAPAPATQPGGTR